MMLGKSKILIIAIGLLPWAASDSPGADRRAADPLVGPLAPDEALKSFELPDGLALELVAAEPDVVDPIALAFDADGRLFVVEMGDYPLGPGEGKKPLGRIKLLEDADGDGRVDKSTVFVDGLSFALGAAPWDGGLLVTCPPEILFFKDTDGDGRADVRQVLFDGLPAGNPQHRANLLAWGIDNWVYVCGAREGATLRWHVGRQEVLVDTHGRDFHFDPRRGIVEPVAGWTQFGMGHDDWGNRFTHSNSDHIRHVVLEASYLERNPYLTLTEPMAGISDHAQAGPVFQISRPQERFNDFSRLGHFTSCCGITVYRGDALGAAWSGAVFTAEPVANLVHCDLLSAEGPTFSARRAEPEREFLASRDNWFRPVNFATGPDGALYVVDMYREHVEHPQWIPLSTQREINVRAGDDRGRIYRVRRRNKPPETAVHLAQASAAQLVGYLSDANGWVRDTAQRLLVERQDLKTAPALGKLVETGPSPQARVQAMWTLEGLQALDDETIRQALADEHPRVREQALRLSERWLEQSPSLVSTVLAMADDPDPRVRFQLALTVGSLDSPQATAVLAVLARRDAASPWHRAALLTARGARESSLISALVDGGDEFPGGRELVRDLSGVVGSRRQADEVADLVARVDRSTGGRPTWWQAAVLDGLAEGLRNRRGDAIALDGTEDVLVRLLTGKSNELVRAMRRLAAHLRLPDRASMRRVLAEARDLAADPDRETSERVEAVWLAANRPFDQVRSDLVALMRPQQPPDLQTAAALALLEANPAEAFSLVLDQWSGLSPPVRGQVVDRALSTRSGREGLLAAIEAGRVLPAELSLAQRTSLLTDSDSGVRSRAEAMLAHVENEDRKRVVEENLGLLSLDSNGARGWQVFRENCGTCHQLENAGRAVGPDLTSVRNHPKRVLLEHILNPSHVIEPSFLTYVVETADGRLMTGMIRSETGQAITLVTSDGTEQTVLREDIEAITSTGKSLMPEGLERNIPQQGLADLIAFLRGE